MTEFDNDSELGEVDAEVIPPPVLLLLLVRVCTLGPLPRRRALWAWAMVLRPAVGPTCATTHASDACDDREARGRRPPASNQRSHRRISSGGARASSATAASVASVDELTASAQATVAQLARAHGDRAVGQQAHQRRECKER